MFPIDRLILIAGMLLILGIASSKLSARVGLPVLVLFLLVGMLAGSEGLGGIGFENYALAHGVGTVALAFILFDGGLRTERSTFRAALGAGVILATAGVAITALLTGLVAAALLDLPLLHGLLLGSIAGSTDAAAVFAVLRARALRVGHRLAATLEIESGSNDPMAVFLTIVCLEVALGRAEGAGAVLELFFRQLALGAAAGWVVGHGTASVVRRITLEAAGLYPVFTGAAALLAYGLAAAFQGSGFLAVYLAGIILGNRRLPFQRGVFVFHDGLAWLAQIVLFVLLGLLSFPSRLLQVAGPGLLIAAALTVVARPVAVAACLAPLRYSLRDMAFIAAGGLKGAVPIVLGMYPLLLGLPQAELLFDVVFFVVLVSAGTQGWTLPLLARGLRLQRPPRPEPPVMLEITSLKDVDADIVEYDVGPDSRAAGRRVRELALPEGVVVAMIVRGHEVIPPRGSTTLQPGDHAFVVLHRQVRPLVDRVFVADRRERPAHGPVEFPLRGSTTVGELEEFYGIRLEADPAWTLDELVRSHVGAAPTEQDRVTLGAIVLRPREVAHGRVESVGLTIGPGAEAPG